MEHKKVSLPAPCDVIRQGAWTIANADCVRSRWWRCSRPPQSRPPWARPQTGRQVADRQPWRGYRAGSSTCNQQ